MTETFYDVLGVDEGATTDEIEAAYRERLKETHPDVSDDEDAGRATRTLIEARDVLVDESERARYDRVGHDAYVGNSEPSVAQSDDGPSTTADDAGADGTGGPTQDRARRERRASERVREERQRAREARQKRRQGGRTKREGRSDGTDASGSTADTAGSSADREANRRRRQTAGPTGTETTSTTYSVREEVESPTSHGPLLPSGRELTMFGIFFPLYPVLLFSALLPAFPAYVNVFLGVCTLLMIAYLQSMPQVSLPLFGTWSVISVVGIGVFGIGYLSLVGVIALSGTILPFGFSVLTASALRY